MTPEDTVAMIARCLRHQQPENWGGEKPAAPTWLELGPVTARGAELLVSSAPPLRTWCTRCGINHATETVYSDDPASQEVVSP
jgi:hypothetical protein